MVKMPGPNTLPFNPATGDTLTPAYLHSLIDGTIPTNIERNWFRSGDDIRLIQMGNLGPVSDVPTIASDSGISDPAGFFAALPAIGVASTYSPGSFWQTVGLVFRSYCMVGYTMTKTVPAGAFLQFFGWSDLRSEACVSSFNSLGLVADMGDWPRIGSVLVHGTCASGTGNYGSFREVTYKGLVMAKVLGDVVPGNPLALVGNQAMLQPFAGCATSLAAGIFRATSLGTGASNADGCWIPIWLLDPVFKAVAVGEMPAT